MAATEKRLFIIGNAEKKLFKLLRRIQKKKIINVFMIIADLLHWKLKTYKLEKILKTTDNTMRAMFYVRHLHKKNPIDI